MAVWLDAGGIGHDTSFPRFCVELHHSFFSDIVSGGIPQRVPHRDDLRRDRSCFGRDQFRPFLLFIELCSC